jgi:DNA replication licensing factor MCM3
MIEQGNKRLIVNINHLREYNSEYCTGLLSDPMEFFPPFERALNEIVNATTTIVPEPGMDLPTYYIGLEGSFGANLMSPRLINSSHLGKLLCIEAIVTRCKNAINIGSLVRPKIAKSVHYCEATQMFITREYRDGQSLSDDLPTSSVYPTEVISLLK